MQNSKIKIRFALLKDLVLKKALTMDDVLDLFAEIKKQ